jgi:hypothetical protein
MKDNLDQLISKRRIKGRFEKRLDKADDDLEKSEALDELKVNDKIKNEDLLNKLDQFKQKSKTKYGIWSSW